MLGIPKPASRAILGLAAIAAVTLVPVWLVRGSAATPGVGAQEALSRLIAGNARFAAGATTAADLSGTRLQELSRGQKPFAVVLTCSDSRVAPEHLFNAGLGELFVVRVAGNVANSDAIASTEYAVAHLGTRLVVVLSHGACGAVTAAAAGGKDTPAVEAMLAQIAPAVAIAREEGLKDEALVDRAIVVNGNKAREKLINQSALLKDLVRKGEIKVLAAKYELAGGKVQWINLDGLSAGGAAPHASAAPAEHSHTGEAPTTPAHGPAPTGHAASH